MPSFTYQDRPEKTFLQKPGIYHAEITACTSELKDGKDVFKLTYTTPEGDISDTLYFTERALWRVERLLKKTGLSNGLTKGDQIELEESTLIGCRLQIRVVEEAYERNGEKKSSLKVKDFFGENETVEKPDEKPAGGTVKKLSKPEN